MGSAGRWTVHISAAPGRAIITWLLPGREDCGATEPLDGLGLKGEDQSEGTGQSFLLSERVATGNGSRMRIKRDGGRSGRTRGALGTGVMRGPRGTLRDWMGWNHVSGVVAPATSSW